jgi:hypothetical protein
MGTRGGSKKGERRGGRKKGTPNKSSTAAREAFTAFVNRNTPRMQKWLDHLANGVRDPKDRKKYLIAPDPRAALSVLVSMGEFCVPKLARTELSGPGGGPIPTANANATIGGGEALQSYLEMVKGE